MADISPQGIPDMGQLLSSFGQNQANIGLTQAQTGLTGANTGLARANTNLASIQAQKTGLEVSMIKEALSALKNIPTGEDEKSSEQSGVVSDPTETGVASTLNKKFYVNPMGPPGIQQYINATAWVNPAEAQRAEEMRKLMVGAQTSKNQNEANDIFQTSSALVNSKAGLQSLLTTTHPGSYLNNVGQAIASMQDKTPEEKDALARNAIQAAAKYSHQYTGRKIEKAGDEYRDADTGFQVVAPKVGPTAGEQIGLGQWLNTPQTVTIDNRDATIKPKDLGISGYQDLVGNKSVKFSVPPPNSSPQSAAPPGSPGSPQSPDQVRSTLSSKGGAPIPGLNPDQSDFVKQLPPAFPNVKGNQKLNPDDLKQRDIYRAQAKDLSQKVNSDSGQAATTITYAKRIDQLLNTPGLTFGPGSKEYTQMQTILHSWLGTPQGQAAGWQVVNKLLNAQQLTTMVKDLKGDESNVQLRLGAYETRAIMENLAANTGMTKDAIKQLLAYQTSDAKYAIDKATAATAAIKSGKSIATFDADYNKKFPKQDLVDTSTDALGNKKTVNYSKFKGMTGTKAQLEEAADHYNIPRPIFIQNAIKAGVVLQ